VGRGDEVTRAARDAKPDVALLDIEMPGMDGLSAAAALHAACPEVKIIILTTFGRPGYLRRAMESGASGFIVKDSPADKLARTIRSVLAGQRVIDPDLAAAALAEGANPLTPREKDVLRAAARNDGATLAQIAAAVYLSEGTVRNYLSSCIQKTGTRNRAEAVRVAQDRGWLLSPGRPPYPPMPVRAGLIANAATLSGPPGRAHARVSPLESLQPEAVQGGDTWAGEGGVPPVIRLIRPGVAFS
jgi:two-component system response regulator DesR